MKQVTTDQAAELLDVPADLISKWKHRGKVTPVGMLQGRGRGGRVPVYRLDELRPLADRYHATRRGAGGE
jgi:phage terminase Nu1 subunit (DNA packaging protein)